MLEKLFELGYLDYKNLLLNKRVELNLSSNDCILLIEIMDLYRKNGIFTDSMLKLTSLSNDELNNSMATLFRHDYVELYFAKNEAGKEQEAYRFTSLFKTIENLLNNEITIRKPSDNELQMIFSTLEDGFKRKLSSSELLKVQGWLEEKAFEDIMIAIDSLRGKSTFKIANIEKKLYSIQTGKTSDLIREIMDK